MAGSARLDLLPAWPIFSYPMSSLRYSGARAISANSACTQSPMAIRSIR
ncbi:MAG: hypothetical protein QOD31_1808, partial [Pseudonocardiales bacterium]|nr:hypothetical protein [Pseudonocardiales bacterium]